MVDGHHYFTEAQDQSEDSTKHAHHSQVGVCDTSGDESLVTIDEQHTDICTRDQGPVPVTGNFAS